jgi:8-oxo-dGTP pyrophosphatase MutT (NUDIX family)
MPAGGPIVATPRPASTVVLVRPAASGFQVFLVRRHDNVVFMAGAHVFPGGRVDEADYIDDPERWCDGVETAVARMPSRPPAEAIAFHVAAVRELFEESGVLLARREGVTSGGAVDFPVAGLVEWRRDLIARRATMVALAAREEFRLTLDALTPFAHWVTPEIESRRFDTSFFFAVAPASQDAVHDEHEANDGAWMYADEAIEQCRAGAIALPPPTWTTLRALSQFQRLEDARAWARAQSAPRIEPRIVERNDGTRIIALPGDALYPPVEGFAVTETRFLLENGRWRPV